jgi:rubrerythrin
LIDLESTLSEIVQDPHRHKVFLLKLAHLEGQGYRKLAKYKKVYHVKDPIFLRHLADEIRHCLFLNRLAKKLGPEEAIDVHTKRYLTKLEVFIIRQINSLNLSQLKELPYILLTHIIEKRAEVIYPLYESVLKHLENPISIQSIIDDELDHLSTMKNMLDDIKLPQEIINNCMQFEKFLFDDFLKGLAKPESELFSHTQGNLQQRP